MRQTLANVLAYACVAIAMGAILYVFWIMSRISKDIADKPKEEHRETISANLPKYLRKYFSVYFGLVALLIILFLIIAVLNSQ